MIEDRFYHSAAPTTAEPERPEQVRIFLAIPIYAEPSAVHHLALIREQLEKHGINGKWTVPSSAHLTLLFLGNRSHQEVAKIDDISQAVARKTKPFSLVSRELASFRRKPRLLFLNWQDNPRDCFSGLVEQIRTKLSGEIFLDQQSASPKPHPHTTIIRFRPHAASKRMKSFQPLLSTDQRIWRWPELVETKTVIRITPTYFCLYQSQLTASRAIHTELKRYYFQASPAEP